MSQQSVGHFPVVLVNINYNLRIIPIDYTYVLADSKKFIYFGSLIIRFESIVYFLLPVFFMQMHIRTNGGYRTKR
jgi:hypothetical protein